MSATDVPFVDEIARTLRADVPVRPEWRDRVLRDALDARRDAIAAVPSRGTLVLTRRAAAAAALLLALSGGGAALAGARWFEARRAPAGAQASDAMRASAPRVRFALVA